MSKLMDAEKKIESDVVKAYKTVEQGVVSGYVAVEKGVVTTAKKVGDACVGALFTQEGESVEEAKKRLRKLITYHDAGSGNTSDPESSTETESGKNADSE